MLFSLTVESLSEDLKRQAQAVLAFQLHNDPFHDKFFMDNLQNIKFPHFKQQIENAVEKPTDSHSISTVD